MKLAKMPKVSVITPTYNRAGLLPIAIRSVLSQDFTDLELLIVDDGSTDHTAEVVREFQAQDDRVHYLKLPENRGIGFARDFGLRQAHGEYIAWIDSDDLWLPGKLSTQVGILDEYPEIEFLFSDFLNVNHLSGEKSRAFALTRAGLQHLVVSHVGDDLRIVKAGFEIGLLRKTFVQLGTVLVRATVLDKVGGFNTTLSISEDLEFCWRADVFGTQYAYVNRVLVERHINDSSITAHAARACRERLKALQVCRRTCEVAQRLDLLCHIREAEHRTSRNLIWAYGRSGQRAKAARAYWKSLRYGLSARTFFFFATAWMGTGAIRIARSMLVSTSSIRGRT